MMRQFCPPERPSSHTGSKGATLATWSVTLVAATILTPVAILAFAVEHGLELAASRPPDPDLLELHATTFRHRAAGEFLRDGKPATAPVVTATIARTLAVMRHQVTATEYQLCVGAQACPAVDRDGGVSDLPVVKVSWRDAHAYALWLSRETGKHFRLPTEIGRAHV